jgi:D-glucosaminate-6-phosphate ammonia-lyase
LGWAFEGELTGAVDGDKVAFATVLPVGGQRLQYRFSGRVAGDTMSGELDLGEYGRARWTARRHSGG